MKKFIKNNESFTCIKCGIKVPKHPSSSRDHCNNCLYGLHVDINPGDRLNTCKGTLKPIGIQLKNQDTKIVYKCQSCHKLIKNIAAPDDNIDEIIRLSKKVYKD